jgi:hypothetical protein
VPTARTGGVRKHNAAVAELRRNAALLAWRFCGFLISAHRYLLDETLFDELAHGAVLGDDDRVPVLLGANYRSTAPPDRPA